MVSSPFGVPEDRSYPPANTDVLLRAATTPAALLDYSRVPKTHFHEAGATNLNDARGSPPGHAAAPQRARPLAQPQQQPHDSEKPGSADTGDVKSPASSPAAAPADKSPAAGAGDSTLEKGEVESTSKPPISQRMVAGSKRFVVHLKNAVFHSWVNVLLVAVPVGIVVKAIGLNASVVFAINAVAIIPLAGMLSHATESVASRLGDTLGALLNVSFGNAVELIIFIIALVKNEIRIVQASLLGSILANLLLILGMAFLFGGLRFREQVYNSTVTQMSACLLSLSVTSLLLPTAFHASFNENSAQAANAAVLKVSRATSVVLLVIYILYLLFQLKSHAYMYESTPQAIIDEESYPGVLADIMNSSSSSDTSSSSSDSDSDSSGSVLTTSKRVRRMFKSRSRRKSSASVSTHNSSVVVSTSSPSIDQPEGYLEPGHHHHHHHHRHHSHRSTTRPSLGAIASGDEADVDVDENDHTSPRIRDFGNAHFLASLDRVLPEGRKRRKKHRRKHKKRSRRGSHKDEELFEGQPEIVPESAIAPEPAVAAHPRVGFAEDTMDPSEPSAGPPPGRLAFNMRQFSSRVPLRPALPKVLSNNVFVQPSPTLVRPVPLPPRVNSGLRRVQSMPGRMADPEAPLTTNIVNRTGPLPPYQHQRVTLHRPGTENDDDDVDDEDKEVQMSRTAAVVLLLVSTALVAVCAEFMVDAIPDMIADSPISQAFIGLIILPIVGNAAEHVTAVTVATKNKMDLAIGVALGSSIQIALFVTPLVVLLGWILNTEMSLYFNLFETVSLVATAFVINFLILDGRSNYLEGSLLIAVYVIIAVVAFFYPSSQNQSLVGGADSSSAEAANVAARMLLRM